MSILIDEQTRIIIQGITGREASTVAREMKEYGTKIVAGVTPGKGGLEVEGIPVYDTVKQALAEHDANCALVYVPPLAAKDAAIEAMANDIPLIDVVTERVPVRDVAEMLAFARKKNARIVGPTSVGIISPEKCKVGPIGGSNVERVYKKGNVGVISKSGGMSTETSWVIRQAGLGQSTVVGLGGDFLSGSNFRDLLELFEQDKETKAVALFGELGGSYEEQAAEFMKQGKFTKPIVAFVAGKFTEQMPGEMQFGHAGAIIEGKTGTPSGKIKALKEAGAIIASVHSEMGELIKEAI